MRLFAWSLFVVATASANSCSCQPGSLLFEFDLSAPFCPEVLPLNDAVQMNSCYQVVPTPFAGIHKVEIVEYYSGGTTTHSSVDNPPDVSAVEVNTTTLTSFDTNPITSWEIYITGNDSDNKTITGNTKVIMIFEFTGNCNDYDLLQHFENLDLGGFVKIVSSLSMLTHSFMLTHGTQKANGDPQQAICDSAPALASSAPTGTPSMEPTELDGEDNEDDGCAERSMFRSAGSKSHDSDC